MELAFSLKARRFAPAYAGLLTNLMSACSHQHGGVQAEKWMMTTPDGLVPAVTMEYQRPSGERVTVVSEAPKKYIPPKDIVGIPWGTKLTVVKAGRPELTLLGAATVTWAGKVASVDMECEGYSRDPKNPGCTQVRIDQRSVGGGLEAMGEYMEPRAAFKFRDTGGLLYPVVLEFCANYPNGSLPKTLHNDLALCGSRMIFSARTDPASQSLEHDDEEATDPEDDESVQHMPNYKRVLFALITHYGFPKGYQRKPTIIIEAADGTRIVTKHKPKLLQYLWCGADGDDRSIAPGCEASISYTYDPNSGVGMVLFATERLFAYAEARHAQGDVNNLLYRALHKDGINRREFPHENRGGEICADCRATASLLNAKERAMFAP
jgi:hypothetical protein